jgi:hypothetical protein
MIASAAKSANKVGSIPVTSIEPGFTKPNSDGEHASPVEPVFVSTQTFSIPAAKTKI